METGESIRSGEKTAISLAHSQLERMRAMQYAYHQKFFQILFISSAAFALLWLLGGRAGVLWIPFLVVTAGFQSSFYLYFCDFARTHASHLERWLNQHCGLQILNAAALEDIYFYPLAGARMSGFSLPAPQSFFSAFTLHWTVLWSAVAMAALLYGLPILDRPWNFLYLAGLGIWGGSNVGYLAWFFIKSRDRQRMDEYLALNLGKPVAEES